MNRLIRILQIIGYTGNLGIFSIYVTGVLSSLNFFVTLVLMAQVGALLALAGAIKNPK